MLITDESLGELFEKLGLLNSEQKAEVLSYKKETSTVLNFYQLAIKFGYIKKGSLDAAFEVLRTADENDTE